MSVFCFQDKFLWSDRIPVPSFPSCKQPFCAKKNKSSLVFCWVQMPRIHPRGTRFFNLQKDTLRPLVPAVLFSSPIFTQLMGSPPSTHHRSTLAFKFSNRLYVFRNCPSLQNVQHNTPPQNAFLLLMEANTSNRIKVGISTNAKPIEIVFEVVSDEVWRIPRRSSLLDLSCFTESSSEQIVGLFRNKQR